VNAIVGLLPLLFGMACYAGYLKLSARFRRFRIGWKPCFAFAYMVGALALLGRFLAPHAMLPGPLPPVLAVVSQLALGGWFFRERARSADGHALGWRRASELVAVAMLLMLGTGVLLLLVVRPQAGG
jgi:hypothetical protein